MMRKRKREAHTSGRDEVTVLICAPGHSASKRITARADSAPEVIGFNAGSYFAVLRKPVGSIRELSELLLALEGQGNALVIRGAPAPSLDPKSGVRRKKTNFVTPPQGRRWVLIDFDKIPLPPGLGVREDATAVAEYLVSLLPSEFHDVSYHYQLSSSAGLGYSTVASMHTWFWLARPWSDLELKSWGKAVNKRTGYRLVDVALFNDVQPHYVAAPVFEGMDDPLPTRSRLVVKHRHEVGLLQLVEPRDEAKVAVGAPRSPSPDFAALLELLGDHPGGEGFHEPIIRATASYIATHGREATDVEWLFETVRNRVLAADRSDHDDAYVENMASREHIMQAIEGALEKFGDGNPRRKARVIPGIDPHYPADRGSDARAAQSHLDKALRSIVKTVPWRSG